MTMTIAIVGMGPWGLCVLDRILHRARSAGHVSLQVHTIEPGVPGAGAHGLDQPAYLLLNTVCGQVNPFCGAGFGENGGGTDSPSLYGWARDRGYRMADGDWRQGGTDGRPVTPDDFLPRRVAGEYLAWAYAKLLESRPGNVTLHHHAAEAVDIRPAGSDGERLTLSTGESLAADHVFLTTGHTPQTVGAAASMGGPALPPDPASFGADAVPVASTVAIAGMGLAATDALAGLTIGRGGRFETLEQEGGEQGTKLRYRPSGGEPRILLFSRQGLPFLSRPSTSLDASGAYRPVIVTQEEIDARRERRRNRSGSDRLDFRADILPLTWAEMTVVFHSRSALLADGAEAADAVARTLGHAWRTGGFEDCAAGYAARHGAFDPETAFFCPAIRSLPDSAAYQAAVRSMLVQDIGQSRLGEADSPVKAALELFRVLRPQIRSAVDFGGLTPDSHRDFRTGIAPLINRAVIGPPLSRNEELLALIDAGIVRAPFGPAPDCRFDSSLRRWTITSTALGLPHSQTAARLIAGHLDQPEVEGSASPLLSALAGAGRIRAYRHGDAPAGGIDIDQDSHPLDRAGRPQPRLWVLGPLTEGVRYFNHYLPSPKSRSKAFAEADACLDRILGEQGGTGAPVPAAAFRGLVGQGA